MRLAPGHGMLTAGEVAKRFGVDRKTVTRWYKQGRLRGVRTPGGHLRLYESEVNALLEASTEDGAR